MVIDEFTLLLDKYRILDNSSNMVAQLSFDKLLADKKIELKGCGYIKFGYIYVSVTNPTDLCIYYKDILLIKLNSSKDTIIPCAFEESSYLEIKGTSDELKIFIYGAEVINRSKMYLIPVKNYIVKDRGKKSILSYTSKDDILNNSLSEVRSIENCWDIQTFQYSGNTQVMYLASINDNLYLYNDTNSYATSIWIAEGVTDAKLVINNNSNIWYVVYIKDDKLNYKVISSDLSGVGEEQTISLKEDYIPKSLSFIQQNNIVSSGYLGVNFYNGSMQVYATYNGFRPRISKTAECSKLIIDGLKLEVVIVKDYGISITKYIYDGDLVEDGDTIDIYNVNDIIKIGNAYLVCNNGVFSEVNIDTN